MSLGFPVAVDQDCSVLGARILQGTDRILCGAIGVDQSPSGKWATCTIKQVYHPRASSSREPPGMTLTGFGGGAAQK